MRTIGTVVARRPNFFNRETRKSRVLVALSLLVAGVARAEEPPCAAQAELVAAPRLRVEIDEDARTLGPEADAGRDQAKVSRVRLKGAPTVGGVRYAADTPLYLRCPQAEVVTGTLADDTLLGGVLYPAGTWIGFRGGRVSEAGITEPLLIGGWRVPPWSIVRFDDGGALASAVTTEGGDGAFAHGPSCFFEAAKRRVRLHTARDCAAEAARVRALEPGRPCGLDIPGGDALEVREAGASWLHAFTPSADVAVGAASFLRGQRLAVDCAVGGAARLRLGTLAAPAKLRGTLFPALTELVDGDEGGRLRARLPMPLLVHGVRYPADTILELDAAGRPRRATLAIDHIIDGVRIGDRLCRLSRTDAIELSEGGKVIRCTRAR